MPSNKEQIPFYALITAAGEGLRCGGQLPKQYTNLNGKPVIRHTIEAFLACPNLQSLKIIINENHREYYESATAGLDLPAPVTGGKTRKESINNGLNYF